MDDVTRLMEGEEQPNHLGQDIHKGRSLEVDNLQHSGDKVGVHRQRFF